MPKATLTSKGQLTLPKEVRSKLGVAAGDQVEFAIGEDGSITVLPVKASALRLHGVIESAGDGPSSIDDINREISDHLASEDERVRRSRS